MCIYLCWQHIIHREDINFWVDAKRSFDFGTNKLRTFYFQELLELATNSSDTLECHVTHSAVRTDIGLLVVDREHAIFDSCPHETIRLPVPDEVKRVRSNRNLYVVVRKPYIVSGLKVAATKKTFLPSSFVPISFKAASLQPTTAILRAVYSWGPKPSPSCRS